MSYSSSSEPAERRDKNIENNKHKASNHFVARIMSLFTAPIRRGLPHIFPLLVCLLCIPLLMFFSGAAGWVVWRNVPVGWKADAHLLYGEAISPFANVQLPPVLADQPYDISLHLVLPATESNFALGNFMITLKLTTAYNESITVIRRSATLVPPHSSLLKQLLLGSPSMTKVDIPLVSQFVSGVNVMNARLELGRSDGWKGIGNGQARELSVLEATLKGTVRPKGIRAILARYPRLVTFISTFTFFFVSLLMVSGCLFTAVRFDSSHDHPSPTTDGAGSNSEDENHSSGPRPNTRRFSKRRAIKRDKDSGSSSAGDEKRYSQDDESGGQLSGLRKQRSSSAIEALNSTTRRSQAKIEVDDITARHSAISPLYPKSPYPPSSSTGSNSSSKRRSTVTNSGLLSGVESQ